VIDLVEGYDCREFLVGEGVDDLLYRFVGPMLQRLFQRQPIQTSRNDLGRTAVPRKLILQRFNRSRFCLTRQSSCI